MRSPHHTERVHEMFDWTRTNDALRGLLEEMDMSNRDREYGTPRFVLHHAEIVPDGDSLRVTLYDASGNAFMYSAYVRGDRIEFDG